jgi:hypothetical protein
MKKVSAFQQNFMHDFCRFTQSEQQFTPKAIMWQLIGIKPYFFIIHQHAGFVNHGRIRGRVAQSGRMWYT